MAERMSFGSQRQNHARRLLGANFGRLYLGIFVFFAYESLMTWWMYDSGWSSEWIFFGSDFSRHSWREDRKMFLGDLQQQGHLTTSFFFESALPSCQARQKWISWLLEKCANFRPETLIVMIFTLVTDSQLWVQFLTAKCSVKDLEVSSLMPMEILGAACSKFGWHGRFPWKIHGRNVLPGHYHLAVRRTLTFLWSRQAHVKHTLQTFRLHIFFGRWFSGICLEDLLVLENSQLPLFSFRCYLLSRLYIFSGPATTLGLYCSCGWCPQRRAIGGLGHHATCTAAHFAKTIRENDTTLIKQGVISHRESKLWCGFG